MRRSRGAIEIFTHANTTALKQITCEPGGGAPPQGFGPDIAHDGQIIAMVVAGAYEAAREAGYKERNYRGPAMPKPRLRRPRRCLTPNTARPGCRD